MTADLYGRLIWGSKALGGNLSLPGVVPRGVKNHPWALKTIFFKISSQYQVICWRYPILALWREVPSNERGSRVILTTPRGLPLGLLGPLGAPVGAPVLH